MSAALDIVKSLAAAGVEFVTDGERIRWRNSGGRMTAEVVATLAADKRTIIDFLKEKARPPSEPGRPAPAVFDPCQRDDNRDGSVDTVAMLNDADLYAEALRLHGPMSYGVAAVKLGWGVTRAGQAQDALLAAGRIRFNELGWAAVLE